MKTGMEYPLIGLIVLVALVVLWNAWSGMQLDLSVAALNATVAGTETPAPVLIVGQWLVKAIVGTVVSGVVIAGVTTLIAWTRKQWRTHQTDQRKWQPGPNAYWGRQTQPKPIGEAELMRMWMMQQMTGNKTGAGNQSGAMFPTITRMDDDEPTITL
jgi:hypothetical protein